eukprot:CAMPEP_0177649912 /NCGR_PEP_ID=MMETSP0447-20121125/11649_1 /TAXON_ID=0 /ORGANISM="Stygamoeba regulata, Strain BSH-02190019" /LENGTH=234 /DNA_ID=CAMNT_0019152721 /DNA_START=80 /DNA_END=784 /DNA_ORIENTATION=+
MASTEGRSPEVDPANAPAPAQQSALKCAEGLFTAAPLRGLRALERFPEASRLKFLHAVLDDIAGKSTAWVSAEEWLPSGATVEQCAPVTTAYRLLYRQAINLKMQPREVLADLLRVQLQQSTAEAVVTALFARQDEVVSALKEEAITGTARTSLKDFDWKLNQEISSDTISSLSEPSLILRLSLAHNDRPADAVAQSQQTEQVFFELNKAELDSLIQKLEGAHSQMVKLKSFKS